MNISKSFVVCHSLIVRLEEPLPRILLICFLISGYFSNTSEANLLISTVPGAHPPAIGKPLSVVVDSIDSSKSPTLYVSDEYKSQIYRIQDGKAVPIIGDGERCLFYNPCLESEDPTKIHLGKGDFARIGLALVPNDFPIKKMRKGLLLADSSNNKLRFLSRNHKKVITVAGTGDAKYENRWPLGDGGPAKNASVISPTSIAVSNSPEGVPDGRVFVIGDSNWGLIEHGVREIDFLSNPENPTIRRVAGGGELEPSVNPQDADKVKLYPEALASTRDGGLLIGDGRKLIKIKSGKAFVIKQLPVADQSHQGSIQSIVEDTTSCTQDGCDILIGWEELYGNRTGASYGWVTRLKPGGHLKNIAGQASTNIYFNGDDIAASDARLTFISGIAVDGSGNVYITAPAHGLIRKLSNSDRTNIQPVNEEKLKPIINHMELKWEKYVKLLDQHRKRIIDSLRAMKPDVENWNQRAVLHRQLLNPKVSKESPELPFATSSLASLPPEIKVELFNQFEDSTQRLLDPWCDTIRDEFFNYVDEQFNNLRTRQGMFYYDSNKEERTEVLMVIRVLNYLRHHVPEPLVRSQRPYLLKEDHDVRKQLRWINRWLANNQDVFTKKPDNEKISISH